MILACFWRAGECWACARLPSSGSLVLVPWFLGPASPRAQRAEELPADDTVVCGVCEGLNTALMLLIVLDCSPPTTMRPPSAAGSSRRRKNKALRNCGPYRGSHRRQSRRARECCRREAAVQLTHRPPLVVDLRGPGQRKNMDPESCRTSVGRTTLEGYLCTGPEHRCKAGQTGLGLPPCKSSERRPAVDCTGRGALLCSEPERRQMVGRMGQEVDPCTGLGRCCMGRRTRQGVPLCMG
mmetsp:Transcript_37442/g.107217  ORF Transcript_37442/g.107217 Transcript_37442/m.107217 type:complete len:239 (-) Transcript_37442:779-1495(-)